MLTRLALAFRPETQLTQRLYQEDAFYTLTVANHFAHGEGFSIDGIHPTNGIQPLIVFPYSVCFFLAGGDRWLGLRLTFILVALFECGCIVLIYKLINNLKRKEITYSIDPAIIGASLWAFLLSNLIHNAIGLETGLYALMILWSMYLYSSIDKREREKTVVSIWRWVGFGAQLGLLVLTRIDAVFFVGAFVLGDVSLRKGALLKKIFPGFVFGFCSLLVSAPWWIYNYVNFGSLMPISGQSESLGNGLWLNIQIMIETIANMLLVIMYWSFGLIVSQLAIVIPMVIILAVITIFNRLSVYKYLRTSYNLRPLLFAITGGIGLVIYYTFFFNAPHFIGRYMHPVRVIILIFSVIAVPLLYDLWQRSKWISCFRIGMSIFLIGGCFFNVSHYIKNFTTTEVNPLYLVGRWALEHPQYNIGMTSSGTAGFVSDNVVNLDGKVNYDALLARRNDSLGTYVVHSGIDVLADWEGNARPIIKQAEELGQEYSAVDSVGMSGLLFYKRVDRH